MTDLSATALPAVLQDALALAAAPPLDAATWSEGPALFDLNDHDRVLVSGRDRVRFLHAMLSNDVNNLAVDAGRWATFNTVQGRTVSDVRLFNMDAERKTGSILALLEPGARSAFVDGLDKFVVSEKVIFEEQPGRFWLVAGPRADDVLVGVGAELPGPDPLAHNSTRVGDADVRLFRLDRSGRDASDVAIWCSDGDEAAVLSALSGVRRGERLELEARRVAAGQLRFGVDFTTSNIPLEAGLKDRAISFTKGCYIGQEVICRIDSIGRPARKLVRLEFDGPPPAPGLDLVRNGKTVGWVTSAMATVGGAAGFGYVKKRNDEPGTVLLAGENEARVGEEL
jgi:folate-binding protein YgfZ